PGLHYFRVILDSPGRCLISFLHGYEILTKIKKPLRTRLKITVFLNGLKLTYSCSYCIFSITIADAPPPPLQIAAAPYLPPFCFSTFIRVTMILEPELPSGCPNETAPPFTFTLAESRPRILLFASPTTEKASLNSKKSTSDTSRPAFLRATGSAFAGAVVNHSGS